MTKAVKKIIDSDADGIIKKIEAAGLIGRGGACFPVANKWKMVKGAAGVKKYVICNAAEGEPGVKKDGFILDNYADRVIDGMVLAMDFLREEKVEVEAWVYLNPHYYPHLKSRLTALIKKIAANGYKINLFKKPPEAGYIGGEESSAINAIEGKKIEPRLRPPFPTIRGLWNCPTLVNNVETFYNVSLLNSGEYQDLRFVTIGGDCRNAGVYAFPNQYSMEKILKETDNYPKFDFFVQVGGDASGVILNSQQLKQPVSGAGTITIHNLKKTKPLKLISTWLDFFRRQSCGQCTPCREGTLRLWEIANSKEPDWNLFSQLLDNLDDSAFCGLGCAVSLPIRSYFENVLKKSAKNKINLNQSELKMICDCFN